MYRNDKPNQGGVAQPESSLGVQVTQAVLPVSLMPVNPDDVVMSESGQAIIRTGRGHLGGIPADEGLARAMTLQAPAFEAFETDIQKVAESVDQVRNDKPLRKVALLGDVRSVSGCSECHEIDTRYVARMESKQDTTQAQLNQHVDQALQVIQMLAARPGVFKGATIPNVGAPTAPARVSTGNAKAAPSEAASHEVARALKAAETQFEERWQRREVEAEKAKESWATNMQKSLNYLW
ncbi:LOW QUALITY PROTEIN: hypothetical protein PHMEG_00027287 [Phytophthora megakarya]|uniref:Uncharacterized protein n=1 Tax=Phytophthora megakarya TaxID=4795 RepID=A0A225V8A3_9STRA|nr:LOW QUALITY PROTEIN: hypothetical protein PHMEG_00027287 [Phytophthora megakarya]